MSIVHGLALAHLSATAVLLLLFVVLISVQRLATSLRGARTADTDAPVAYPSTAERSAIPVQDAAPEEASVPAWRVDLRDEDRPTGSRQLQRSS